jgi:hypothetical protein
METRESTSIGLYNQAAAQSKFKDELLATKVPEINLIQSVYQSQSQTKHHKNQQTMYNQTIHYAKHNQLK